MKFCNKCFSDLEIKSVIENVGTPLIHCDICDSKKAILYNTETNHELTDYFNDLISIYTPSNQLPPNFPKGELKMLKDELKDRWKIFSPKLSSGKIYDIVTSICAEQYLETPQLFNELVGIAEQIDQDSLFKKK